VASEFGVSLVAVTLRESLSASDNAWSAVLLDAKAGRSTGASATRCAWSTASAAATASRPGLIYALVDGRGSEAALAFAVAASALKQTIPGDFNHVSVGEVERLVGGDASGRVRRPGFVARVSSRSAWRWTLAACR
jgi:2-dehydro-3-deoxygluconokinase